MKDMERLKALLELVIPDLTALSEDDARYLTGYIRGAVDMAKRAGNAA